MKKFAVYGVLLIALLLSGCGTVPSQSGAQEQTYETVSAKYFFADELDETDLPKPDRVISSRADFVYALDYLSFYRIDRKTAFDISAEYAQTISAVYPEYGKALQEAQLAEAYPITFDSEYYRKFRIVAIDLRIVDVATLPPSEKDETAKFVPPFDYNPCVNARSTDYDGFYINDNNRGEVAVTSTEQLWYAVNKGYLPVPQAGSVAETVYEEAKSVLRRIVSDSMSEYQKLKAIYGYLTCEIRYDRETLKSSVNLNAAQCYYLEGVFLNGYAVCDGKAKAYCLLGGMEGLDVLRATDFNDDFEGHAYNYVCLDNKWYLSCTTFGSVTLDFGTEEESDKRIVCTYNMFLTDLQTPYGDDWGYDSAMYADVAAGIDTAFDYWAQPINGTQYNLTVSSAEEWLRVLQCICENGQTLVDTEVEFKITDTRIIDDIMLATESGFPESRIEFIQNRPLEQNIYGCLFLAK